MRWICKTDSLTLSESESKDERKESLYNPSSLNQPLQSAPNCVVEISAKFTYLPTPSLTCVDSNHSFSDSQFTLNFNIHYGQGVLD